MLPQKRVVAFALLLAFAAPWGARSDSDAFARAISLCDVVTSPEKFREQVILLRVVYWAAPEHAPATTGDALCPDKRIVVRYAKDYREDESVSSALQSLLPRDMSLLAAPEIKPIDAVYKGTFRIAEGIECSGLCSRFVLDNAELVAVRAQR